LAYLDGEADEETISHLKGCAYCRERAQALDRLQNRLTRQLYRLTCPSSIELGEYHLRMLPASQMLVIAQHVRECPHCAREIDQLEEFFLGDLQPTEGSLLGKVKVLIARLAGGGAGASAPAFAALRGEAKGPLTLEADGIVIVLDIQPGHEGKVNILGQVAADDQAQWTEATVELRHGGELQFSTTVDDLGAFQAEGILPGSTEIQIIPKDRSLIVVSNFEIPT
jgi:hypothetical protein